MDALDSQNFSQSRPNTLYILNGSGELQHEEDRREMVTGKTAIEERLTISIPPPSSVHGGV